MEIIVACLECAADVSFGEDVLAGEIAECAECGIELEVISVDPLKVDFAPEVEEDWGEQTEL